MRRIATSREVTVGLLLVLLLAAARVAFLPYATTDGGDSVSRVWHTISWLEDPHLITHGLWGPLHYYLLAFVLWIWPDPVHGPVALHLLIGVATPLLIYAFTRTAIAGPRAALLVAATAAIYPIAIRNSLSVRAEVPFVLLILVTMIFVELARRDEGSWKHALAAGMSLTLAAMLRYEAWMLIPFLALLLWRKPRLMGVFISCALIHPVFWMVGNGIHSGDPLFSVNVATRWERERMGRAMIPLGTRILQALTYPGTILRGMTFPVGLIALAGATVALIKRERSRAWLLPMGGLALLLMWSIGRGALVPKINYTVTIGTMLLPFAAVIWRRIGVEGWPLTRVLGLGVAVVGLMVFSTRWSWMNAVGLAKLKSIDPVPTIPNQETALTLPGIINRHMPTEPALISDFYGWGVMSYVAFLTRLHPDRVLLVTGAPNNDIDLERLSAFLERYPEGILIALEGSRLWKAIRIDAGRSAKVGELPVLLDRVHRVPWLPGKPPPHLDLFRYRLDGDRGRDDALREWCGSTRGEGSIGARAGLDGWRIVKLPGHHLASCCGLATSGGAAPVCGVPGRLRQRRGQLEPPMSPLYPADDSNERNASSQNPSTRSAT